MDINELRKKYKLFVFEKYDYEILDGNLIASFYFNCGEFSFKPSVIFKNINFKGACLTIDEMKNFSLKGAYY